MGCRVVGTSWRSHERGSHRRTIAQQVVALYITPPEAGRSRGPPSASRSERRDVYVSKRRTVESFATTAWAVGHTQPVVRVGRRKQSYCSVCRSAELRTPPPVFSFPVCSSVRCGPSSRSSRGACNRQFRGRVAPRRRDLRAATSKQWGALVGVHPPPSRSQTKNGLSELRERNAASVGFRSRPARSHV